jgi:hypothetical protein
MSEQTFDAFSRHAAMAVSRRTSLLALGGMALAAATATPGATAAKSRKNRKRQKGKKDVLKLCAPQVNECKTAIGANCGADASCLVVIDVCCPLLGKCQNSAFWDCVIASITPA